MNIEAVPPIDPSNPIHNEKRPKQEFKKNSDVIETPTEESTSADFDERLRKAREGGEIYG